MDALPRRRETGDADDEAGRCLRACLCGLSVAADFLRFKKMFVKVESVALTSGGDFQNDSHLNLDVCNVYQGWEGLMWNQVYFYFFLHQLTGKCYFYQNVWTYINYDSEKYPKDLLIMGKFQEIIY